MKTWKIKADIREIVIEALNKYETLDSFELDKVVKTINQITDRLYNTINKQVNQHLTDFFKKLIDDIQTNNNP